MRPVIITLFTVVILGLLVWYNMGALRAAFGHQAAWLKRGITVLYIGAHVVLVLGLVYVGASGGGNTTRFMPWFGFMILLLIPDLLLAFFLLLEDFIRLLMQIFTWVSGSEKQSMPARRAFISKLALAAAAVPFISIAYGITKGKYNYKIKRVKLFFSDLPDAFDGLTISQISDLHTGSFDNPKKVAYGVQMLNELKSDLIFFTGDLVNNKAEEAESWIETFKDCSAPMGKFSILGNHDYGDYVPWPDDGTKQQNLERLKEIHQEMGFKLLLNEHINLEKNGEALSILGVENWGNPPFVQYGDLDKAIENSKEFRLLLSHDPSHFDEKVVPHHKKVHLTLSGHTHGMQFGIDIGGFKWSPVKWKYPKWSGLYQEKDQYLYVNQGFGYLAFPGRVGMWPEITQITLHKA